MGLQLIAESVVTKSEPHFDMTESHGDWKGLLGNETFVLTPELRPVYTTKGLWAEKADGAAASNFSMNESGKTQLINRL